MANEGSPNPSSLIVNLLEDARQSDPEKLKVTAYPAGATQGMKAWPDEENAAPGETKEVVSRTVPENTVFHLTGFDGQADVDSAWEVKVDEQVVGVGATSAAQPVAEKRFDPAFRVEAGKTVTLHARNDGAVAGAFKGILRGWDEPA